MGLRKLKGKILNHGKKMEEQEKNVGNKVEEKIASKVQSGNKQTQAERLIAHFKGLDKRGKQPGKTKDKKNDVKKRRAPTVENQITSLKIISRAAAKVREMETSRQPFMDYSVDYHPHITNKNVDKLLYLETNTLAVKKSLVRSKILHERETLKKMRGVCIYIKAKLPTAIEKFKNKSKLEFKNQKSLDKTKGENAENESELLETKCAQDSGKGERKIEIDITTIHSVLGLSGLELLEDIDTSEVTKIRHRLLHVKESIISKIPEASADFVIKGLIQFDPNRLIGLVPMLLSVVKYKFTNPNFWASVVHELWLFIIVSQHNNLKVGDQSTEKIIKSLNNTNQSESNLQRNQIFPDYFIAINYLLSGMVDTKIPGVLRLLVRLNMMYYYECRINTLILFCNNPMELWVDCIKISSLLNNIDSLRTLLTSLSESKDVDIQQLAIRIFSSNLTSIIFFHLINSPISLVHDRNNLKLITCYIEFLNECLLIGHSKELLSYVSTDEFVNKYIVYSTFGQGYKFYSELDADNIYLDKHGENINRSNQDRKENYSVVGYDRNQTNIHLRYNNEKYNIWDIFSIVCDPKYKESILYPIVLFLADAIYFSFVYEVNWEYDSLKNLLISIIQLNKHFKKSLIEIGNEGSFSQILLEDTKIVKKYLRLLYNGQDIDLKRLQEWITDRRIKESTISRKLEESAKVPCFHPSCNNFTVGSKVRSAELNKDIKINQEKRGDLDFRYCRRCFVVSYCSDKCQKSHWKLSHSSSCGLMAVPPASLIFNSTVNWPIRLHLHNTKDEILESESVTYLQDKYYNNIYNNLSFKVFFDSCNLSIPYPLTIKDQNIVPYHCGLRECVREHCLKCPSSENGLKRVNAFEHKNLLVYRELHNNQKLLMQIGDPRIN
ncbi:MYND finger family protein [Cryptosporidium meleagridis]|uniref:MYND finger family protein n=1 Tax=Cryptosporidium meleagridis TaxID=93969 RepID=A0A2P4Z1E8_9CRYT|nr:MYND finger family protein [Cryptosporidium meleagridis]